MQLLLRLKIWIGLLGILAIPVLLSAQNPGSSVPLSNLRYRWLSSADLGKPFLADSLSVAAETLQLISTEPESKLGTSDLLINYDPNSNLLTVSISEEWKKNNPQPQSIFIRFRVYPYRFDQPAFLYDRRKYENRSTTEMDSSVQVLNFPATRPQNEALFDTDNLQKSGTLTRGLSFGNTQNVFVNSALNLQLEGYITDDIYLTAAISDQQVPFQPDGNTQQIQDFDRVYLELKHQKALLRAGDITLRNDSASYFLKYFKNVQGAQAEVYWGDHAAARKSSDVPYLPQKELLAPGFSEVKKEIASTHGTTQIGASLARGQFRTQMLTPLEGVLGPYRLSGPNNERFLIVMANSEKVWLDGQLLERGFQNDYVIDYNQAEITFTPNVLITRFSRIRVDFEFATQEYSRSILQGSHQQVFKKGEAYVRVYREKDNENAPLGFELGDEELATLQQAGDRPNTAFTIPIDTLENFTPEQILYTQKDTLVNGETYRIFERATQNSNSFYRLSFTQVGLGNGDYVLENSTTNGQVFRWVAPESGERQGSFTPGRPITAPNSRQMISAGGKYQLGRNGFAFAEVALSNQDLNLLSSLDDGDNHGQAITVGYQQNGIGLGNRWETYGKLQVEYDQANFQPIDRFRAVEFDRDWSLNLDSLGQQEERLAWAGWGIRRKNERQQTQHDFFWETIGRERSNAVEGLQHHARWSSRFSFLNVTANGMLMQADLPNYNGKPAETEWKKANVRVSVPGKKLVPGYSFYLDQNVVSDKESGAVLRSAMHAQSHTVFLENGDSLQWKLRTDFTWREDESPLEGKMQPSFRSQTANLKAERNWNRNRLAFTLTFRDQERLLAENIPNEQTINGRLDWRQHFWKKNIQSDVTWQTSASQELRREFVFVRVATGLGTHTWRDDNGDGLQDLNEFYEALNPDERNYVKYFVPTTDYVPAYLALYNHRIRYQFPGNWFSQGGIQKVLSRFSGQMAYVAERKTNASEWRKRFLPFGIRLEEAEMLSERSTFRHNLFFNQQNPKFGADWEFFRSDRKNLLTNGFESRQQREHTVTLRWNLNQQISTQTEISSRQLSNQSDWLTERNFEIQSRSFAPEVSWQPNPSFRLSTVLSLRKKSGSTFDEESETQLNPTATFTEGTLKIRWAQAATRSLNAEWKITRISYDGEVSSPIGYEMLEALLPGRNLRWQVFFTQRITKGLQMNVTYNGRKSGSQSIIHLGQMQVTALF